jgi:hypothetical protein
MKLASLTSLSALVAVALPVATATAALAPTNTTNWLVLFFAFTTFYSEGLAAIPAVKANAIYQQIGQLLNFVAMFLRSR